MAHRTLRRARVAPVEPSVSVEQPIGVAEPVEGITEPIANLDSDLDDGDFEFVEPAGLQPSSEPDEPQPSAEPAKRRGRPRGAKSGTRSPKTQGTAENLVSLETVLLGVHTCLSVLCKNPDLMLDEDEAKLLSKAINKVNEQYSYSVLSPKQAAWFNLLTAMGTVYGPRAMAMTMAAPKGEAPTNTTPATARGEVLSPDKQPRSISRQPETINGN